MESANIQLVGREIAKQSEVQLLEEENICYQKCPVSNLEYTSINEGVPEKKMGLEERSQNLESFDSEGILCLISYSVY